MDSSKGDCRDINISRGSEEGEEPSSSTVKKRHIKHPPIETQWCLPTEKKHKHKPPSGAIKTLLHYPAKLVNPLKTGKSRSMKLLLEGTPDPKDETFVESFRELLFIDGQLYPKHNDYHTLLR